MLNYNWHSWSPKQFLQGCCGNKLASYWQCFKKINYRQMFTGGDDWSQRSFGLLSCGDLIDRNGEVAFLVLFLPILFSSILSSPHYLGDWWLHSSLHILWSGLSRPGPSPHSQCFSAPGSSHSKMLTLSLVEREGSAINIAKAHYVHTIICPGKQRQKIFRCHTFIGFQEQGLNIHCRV